MTLRQGKHGKQTQFKPYLTVHCAITYSCLTELFLKIFNNMLVHLEGLTENIWIDKWIRSKDNLCYGDETRILAAETGKSNSISLSYIKLEVNETNWKDEDISCI
jgi:hypothetical protein